MRAGNMERGETETLHYSAQFFFKLGLFLKFTSRTKFMGPHVMHGVKPAPVIQAFHVIVLPVQILAAQLLIQVSANVPQKAVKHSPGSQPLGTDMGDPAGVSDSWANHDSCGHLESESANTIPQKQSLCHSGFQNK